ncbi:MAG TPA: hemolysin family protein [Polyangiaceae bacterium]
MSELIVILLLVLANAVFAGAEIALVALRKNRIQELAEQGHGGARAVLALRGNPERFLATVQVGITVVGAAAAAFGGRSIAARLELWLVELGWFENHEEGVALAIVIAGVSYLTVVIGELVPKSLALRGAETYALLIARPLLWLSWVARPLVWLLSASANLVLKPFGDKTTFTETRHSAEELREIVAEASQAGTIPPATGEIVSRALELPDLTAADVMVPRQNVIMLVRGASRDELRRVLLEHKYSRVPVYEGTTDNVVGYIVVKDVIALAWERELFVLEDLIRPAFFVPETKRVVELINEMRTEHSPFAIVVDEHGGTSGIVTIEDLVEELVGEIVSEHTRQAREGIHIEDDGSALVSGPTPIREINRALDIELPEGTDFGTIAGLCLSLAGRVPTTGEHFVTMDGIELEVVDASERRIRSVRVRTPKPAET